MFLPGAENAGLFGGSMRFFICTFLVFFYAASAFSWGIPGHEAIGIIAEKNLNRVAKARIKTLLKSGEDLAQASLWPDQIKYSSNWPHTRPYHYVSIPNKNDYYSALDSLSSSEQEAGDIVRALIKAEDVLRSPKGSRKAKADALRFLVHFIGDLHQPLHVGVAEDKGGNSIDMSWHGNKTNLHAVWDTHLISTFLNPSFQMQEKKPPQPTGMEYFRNLRKPSQNEITKWQSSYIMTWLNESLSSRGTTYKGKDGSNEAYFEKSIDPLNERVLQAGFRLAAWLNAILDNQPFKEVEAAELRADLDEILKRPSSDDIALEPQALSIHRNDSVVDIESACDHSK